MVSLRRIQGVFERGVSFALKLGEISTLQNHNIKLRIKATMISKLGLALLLVTLVNCDDLQGQCMSAGRCCLGRDSSSVVNSVMNEDGEEEYVHPAIAMKDVWRPTIAAMTINVFAT